MTLMGFVKTIMNPMAKRGSALFLHLVMGILLLNMAISASAESMESLGTAILNSSTLELPLDPWAKIIRDPGGGAISEEMLARSPAYQNPGKRVASFGFDDASYWFVLPIENRERFTLERLLVFEPTWLDDVRVTLIHPDGTRQVFQGGDKFDFRQRSVPHRKINFDLKLPPGRNQLLVRVQTRDPFFVGMTLWERSAFYESDAHESTYFGLINGALGSLLIFNFVVYLSTRDKAYLAYAGYLLAFVIVHSVYNGFAFPILFQDLPELSNWAHSTFIYIFAIAGLIFSSTFLELKKKLARAYRWTNALLILILISFVVTAVIGGYRWHVRTSILWVVVYSIFALVIGIYSFSSGNRAARFYLSASTAGLTGSAVTSLTVAGLIPYSFIAFRAVDFGMLIDAVLLSLALADRVAQVGRLERMRRFFSPAVADKLLSGHWNELLRPHRREIVVLFVDLRGYTAFTEKHGPDEVMRVLSEFHAAMGELITAYGATLERFAGDGMMIFFNDPVDIPDPAEKGVRMAIDMQTRFKNLQKVWSQRNYSLSMGIGLAQGVATIGAIGFEGRRDYGAIGSVTNLAARLCSEAKPGQILACDKTVKNVTGEIETRHIGGLSLKGFSAPVYCHEIAYQ